MRVVRAAVSHCSLGSWIVPLQMGPKRLSVRLVMHTMHMQDEIIAPQNPNAKDEIRQRRISTAWRHSSVKS